METDALLDTSILIEEKKGLTTMISVVEHPKAAHYEVHVIYPVLQDWNTAFQLSSKLYAQGTPCSVPDLLIASIALRLNLTVRTKDHDFQVIQKVAPELCVSLEMHSE